MTMIFWEDHGEHDYWLAVVEGNLCVGRIDLVFGKIYSGKVSVSVESKVLKASYISDSLTDAMLWLGRAYVQLVEAMKGLVPDGETQTVEGEGGISVD